MNEQPNHHVEKKISPQSFAEETLVTDPRGKMTPSQFVERKLVTILRTTSLPVSMIHSDRYTGR